ncbi:MAG: hypothetical protein PHS93_09325 [Candidatus Omnitrophica bacterium]|nr:hypothetical protein [Candidatus Omnitrophota bacterium]MDD5551508.1 hypothetical protein [Candidatus Omnitrophota bacterium]
MDTKKEYQLTSKPEICHNCNGETFWLRPDKSEWVCQRCHPQPPPENEAKK